jgi:hypothetical protein
MHFEKEKELLKEVEKHGMKPYIDHLNGVIEDDKAFLVSFSGLHEPLKQELFSKRQGNLEALKSVVKFLTKL